MGYTIMVTSRLHNSQAVGRSGSLSVTARPLQSPKLCLICPFRSFRPFRAFSSKLLHPPIATEFTEKAERAERADQTRRMMRGVGSARPLFLWIQCRAGAGTHDSVSIRAYPLNVRAGKLTAHDCSLTVAFEPAADEIELRSIRPELVTKSELGGRIPGSINDWRHHVHRLSNTSQHVINAPVRRFPAS